MSQKCVNSKPSSERLVKDIRRAKRLGLTFITSAFSVAAIIGTARGSLFPFILPSSSTPNDSLLTLQIMLVATIIFLPLIIAYISWIYYMLRGRVTLATIGRDNHAAD